MPILLAATFFFTRHQSCVLWLQSTFPQRQGSELSGRQAVVGYCSRVIAGGVSIIVFIYHSVYPPT